VDAEWYVKMISYKSN